MLYKEALREALESDYLVLFSVSEPYGRLANAMSAAEFTSVEMGQFTQELAEGRVNNVIREQTKKAAKASQHGGRASSSI